MTYGSNSLTGISKFIQITETIKGAAPIGGTFRLSFKGSMTDDIPVDASTNPTTLASNMDTKLELLDTIPSGGVTVSASIVSTNNVLYKVTFTHSDLGGDVEALQVVPAFNKLTGTDIAIVVATDGALAGGAPSTRGNELSGSFQLSFRNYKTPPISFDAADTELKAMLETLPNIGTVVVTRTGPTSWKEYDWTITFLSTPGFFPIGSGDLPMMTSVITSLVGTTAAASICPVGTTCRDGSKPFGGYFSLTLNTQTTANIAASATESEMTSALNALSTIGTVSVSRKVLSNGLKWYITFDGCKIYNGGDVCNVGNVNPLTYTDISLSSSMTSPSLSVTEETPGVGPGSCVGSNTGLCVSNMTDLSGSSPYSFVINNLNTGNPYYVRVAAHNSIGFGYSAIPVPNFVVPTYNPPGAPPPVRLVSSLTTSITVEWSLPRENGGAIVDGYELWMDDWSGGNSRLVFDGTGQPTVLQFTISTSTSLVITSGKSYRFTVRAVNYCIATDLNKLCYGEFSEPAVFTARAPRAPLAPPMPYRTSATDTEILSGTATTIDIRWNAPIDNGGALLTNYYVNYAAPSDVTYTQVALSAASAKLDTTNGALVLQYKLTITQTPPPLGNVYRFYIVAENSIGRSPASPILSVVLGKLPGFDMYTSYPHTLTYASNSPLISSVDSTSISLNWPIPAYNALGGNPITGYKVYMFAGVSLNTLATPTAVLTEIQTITTSKDTPGVGSPISGDFSLSFNGTRTIDLPFDVSEKNMKAALEDLPGVREVTITRTNNEISDNSYVWTVTFEGSPGDLPMLYATPGRLNPVSKNVKITVQQLRAGSDSLLVYDGTGIPEVRSVTISNLVPDMTYAFKVAPVTALGEGVLSQASTTVAASSGANAAYSTASGTSLSTGITYRVNEEQFITSSSCPVGPITITLTWTDPFGVSNSGSFTTSTDLTALTTSVINVFKNALNSGDVDVDIYTVDSNDWKFRVVFYLSGDVNPVIATAGTCTFATEEYIKGISNQFTIEPKTASGTVVRDVTTAAGFSGTDLFLTESYINGLWYRDHGLAQYNPLVYEIQRVVITGSTTLQLYDYLTPPSTSLYKDPSAQVFSATLALSLTSSAADVQKAIETLTNVDAVDVYLSAPGDFRVTFLSNLGDVPLLQAASGASITPVQDGICEIQTITIASDDNIVKEVQQVTLSGLTSSSVISVSFPGLTAKTFTTTSTLASAVSAQLATTIASFTDVSQIFIVDVTESSSVYSVTFTSPVGNVPAMTILIGSTNQPVTKYITGSSPLGGTFTVFFEGEYSADINFDASAGKVKSALEQMSTIGTVGVSRHETINGYKWTVSFTQNVGNLRMMEASPIRYEVQQLTTTGGSPTPLNGLLTLTYGGDSAVITYDATADELKSALESMPSVGRVEVSRQVVSNGQFIWLITFRAIIGNVAKIGVDYQSLLGSNAFAKVDEITPGSYATLSGKTPRLAVIEKVSGRPDYTGTYTVDTPGLYETRVSQLDSGLLASYYDNQWFYGAPSIERIDPSINFNWDIGLLTDYSADYVSIRWAGKFVVDKSEMYTIYLTGDDSVSLMLNHTMLLNKTDTCCVEQRAHIFLTAGVYYDLVIEYVELVGSAFITLQYSSASVRKQIIPSSRFYHAT